jgi:4,5-DOPA dioxygenase extradiol
MPTIFFGHGNPMNALAKNSYTEAWAAIGKSIPRPKAVLAVSAHWYIPYCAVTSNLQPPTIHDFGGFPEELYQVEYPAPGSLELASRVQDLLGPAMLDNSTGASSTLLASVIAPASRDNSTVASSKLSASVITPVAVRLDESWGLDHGTWSVLKHVFPAADIPIVQLSIDRSQSPLYHYELGKRLAPLREDGVLIIGSGNIVHNLSAYVWDEPGVQPFDWALRFEAQARELMLKGEDAKLVNYENFGRDARLAAPTPEHYLPLLYVLGLRQKKDKVSFPVEGVDGGSISMLAIQIG